MRRPTHAYMGLSPGLDFESKLFAKTNAAELLRAELSAAGYAPRTIALGANTDPYQPIERSYRITRQVLEVLSEFNHPVGIVTKSALVMRDLDILKPMAERGLVKVAVSVTTLDAEIGAGHGAARRNTGQAAGCTGKPFSGRHSDRRHGGADHSGGERQRDRSDPDTRSWLRASAKPAMLCCACPWR